MRGDHRYRLGVSVVLVGLALSVGLSVVSRSLYQRSEQAELRLRARDAASFLATASRSVETPIVSAAAIAEATHASPASFETFAGTYVGPRRPLSSLALWGLGSAGPQRLASVGAVPSISAERARALFAHVLPTSGVHVSYLAGRPAAVGYLLATGPRRKLFVVGTSLLPTGRIAAISHRSLFSGLGVALYLETRPHETQLVLASVGVLPVSGAHTSVDVKLGDATLELTVVPRGALLGEFFADFAWIVLVTGALLAVAAAVLAQGLARRRQAAEDLARRLDDAARENRLLYEQQRTIAETLQQALLPDVLPEVPGLELEALYVAGVRDLDIGGDWYDVISLHDSKLLVVVGDVSGRGVRAATVMAALRYATRAYAVQGDLEQTILEKLSVLLSAAEDGHFATVICAVVDVAAHRLTLTSAGHPPPLLVSGDGTGHFPDVPVGVPVGVLARPTYDSVTVEVPACATLLFFTDGLVERRGEVLDVGLERLLVAASAAPSGSLADTLAQAVAAMMPGGPEDDVAMVGLRWTT